MSPATSCSPADPTSTSPSEQVRHVHSGVPFRADEALTAGAVTKHDLRTRFRRLAPNVYVARSSRHSAGTSISDEARDARTAIAAAWLWSQRRGVLAGHAAAVLLGTRWVSPGAARRVVDLYLPNSPRPTAGVRLRHSRGGLAHVVTSADGIVCTAAPRTTVDVARWTRSDDDAIIAVDAICNATGTPMDVVTETALAMRGAHGIARVLSLLPHCDGRADSPQETRLRLIVRRSPLPDPEPQVTIVDEYGGRVATADLAFRRERVALFYDGEHHLAREQRDWDSHVTAELSRLGWRSLRVTAGMLRTERQLLLHIAELLRRQGATITDI